MKPPLLRPGLRTPRLLYSPLFNPCLRLHVRRSTSSAPKSRPDSSSFQPVTDKKLEERIAKAREQGGHIQQGMESSQEDFRNQLDTLEQQSKHRLRHGTGSKNLTSKIPEKNEEGNKPMFEELALLLPAVVPDDPMGIIRKTDSVARLLDNPALVVERRIEMLNVFLVLTHSDPDNRASNNAIAT
jgi:hypothetical protein